MEIIKIGLITLIIAQLLKIPVQWYRTGKLNWSLAFKSSGMPSSHTAILISATTYLFLTQGGESLLFGVTFIISGVVIYDAINVRYQAGLQAKVLNQYFEDLGYSIAHLLDRKGQDKFKETMGHTISEVIAAIFLGIVLGIILA